MMSKALIIESVNRELSALKELVQELQERPGLQDEDLNLCDQRLKRVESDLKKIRRQHFDHGKYSGAALCHMIARML